jgi:HlyD family secretion protein
MDRPLAPSVRRKKTVKRSVQAGAGLGAVALLFAFVPGWLSPSLDRDRIRTAIVEYGPVEATISASGTVVPEFEQDITSPIDSRVLRILRNPGDSLKAGDAIVELDVGAATLALERLQDRILLNANKREQLELDLANKAGELESQYDIKRLQVEFLGAKTEQLRRLLEIGGTSAEQLRQAELEEEIAKVELAQLEQTKATSQQSLETQLEGVDAESRLLCRERDELARQLEMAAARTDRDGILTWVVPREGTAVRKGDVIARCADFSTFRVDATVSDIHANKISVGMPAKIEISDSILIGEITAIRPTIENGIISLAVGLQDNSSRLLRSNLRVDVHIITAGRENALRIRRGATSGSMGSGEVFVIKDGVAVKTPVRLGVSSFEYFEVIDGLNEGDEVIISDVSDYMHMSEIGVH